MTFHKILIMMNFYSLQYIKQMKQSNWKNKRRIKFKSISCSDKKDLSFIVQNMAFLHRSQIVVQKKIWFDDMLIMVSICVKFAISKFYRISITLFVCSYIGSFVRSMEWTLYAEQMEKLCNLSEWQKSLHEWHCFNVAGHIVRSVGLSLLLIMFYLPILW